MKRKLAKRKLTKRFLDALQPPVIGERKQIMDTEIAGFGFSITNKSAKGTGTFFLYRRYPGNPNPARRALGQFPAMSVEEARDKAGDWLRMIGKGIDPKAELERQQQEHVQAAAQAIATATAVSLVAEDFISAKLSNLRRGVEVARSIRRDIVGVIGNKTIAQVTADDIEDLLLGIRHRGAPTQARQVLGYAKRMFRWASKQKTTEGGVRLSRYGMALSPCEGIKPSDLFDEKPAARDHVLSDDEMWAFWRVVSRWPYPFGPVYQMLALTGLRLNENGGAQFNEFDFAEREWTIPKERMKAKSASKAVAHLVPLTEPMLKVLALLPDNGGYLYSTNGGESQAWFGDRIKKRLDQEMLAELRLLAKQRGQNAAKITLAHWTNHDIRRTVRTAMSKLRIDPDIAEAVLAHKLTGIRAVYDHYDRLDEKREALEKWGERLLETIVAERESKLKDKTARAA